MIKRLKKIDFIATGLPIMFSLPPQNNMLLRALISRERSKKVLMNPLATEFHKCTLHKRVGLSESSVFRAINPKDSVLLVHMTASPILSFVCLRSRLCPRVTSCSYRVCAFLIEVTQQLSLVLLLRISFGVSPSTGERSLPETVWLDLCMYLRVRLLVLV
jgi:hypothetical protein